MTLPSKVRLLVVTVLVVMVPAWAATSDAQEAVDPPRVGLVGDSIMLGASTQLTEALTTAGFAPIMDAEESRSTSAGAQHVRFLAAGDLDAIVVMLGANDAGDPDTYRARVAEVIAAAEGVPRLYWMTIPEVRDYYPAANRIVAEELAARPGGEVLDWSPVSAADGITASDGMHLSTGGAEAMAGFVALNLASDLLEQPNPIDLSDVPEESDGAAGDDQGGSAEEIEAALDAVADPVETFSGPGGVAVAVGVVLVILASSGVGIAFWALWSTRRIRHS